jgi:uncharacterized protein (DUF1778 family)
MYSICEYSLRSLIEESASMARTAESKQDRLQLRLDPRSKRVLQRAADFRHKTVTQFVLSTALREAEKVIRENATVPLADQDWKIFYDALIDPPAPNPALRKAFRRYRKSA